MATRKQQQWWKAVPPIVAGQEVFSREQMQLLLGGISASAYYQLCAAGLLKWSRRQPGGERVHTLQQYRDYVEYLDAEAKEREAARTAA